MGWYLLDNTNPHAAGGFHGHASRRAKVRLVVIHTTENAFDEVGPDDGAEDVAAYLARTSRQASYHDVFDSDSHVRLLPWEFTAFGARGYNANAIHIAFAGRASDWDTLTRQQIIDRLTIGADVAADALAFASLPAVHLSDSDARNGGRGMAGHGQLDPDRRYDPGDRFDWTTFTTLIKEHNMDYQHPHPDPTSFPFDGVDDEFARVKQAGIYTDNTPKAGLVNTASLAFYIDGLLDIIDGLRGEVRTLRTELDGHKAGHVTSGGDGLPDHTHFREPAGTTGGVVAND